MPTVAQNRKKTISRGNATSRVLRRASVLAAFVVWVVIVGGADADVGRADGATVPKRAAIRCAAHGFGIAGVRASTLSPLARLLAAKPATCASTSTASGPAPARLAVTAQTATTVTLTWAPVPGAVAYTTYRKGTAVASVTTTNYTFDGLSCGSKYRVGVDAVDASGGHSRQAMTWASTLRCGLDVSPPSGPTGLSVSGQTPTSLTLSWNASTDDVAVAGYTVYIDGASAGTTDTTSYSFGGLLCGASYMLGVDAYDTAGNSSAVTSITAATAACPDTTAPTPPAGLSVAPTATSLTLSWSASGDNVGVAGYELYRDGTSVGTTQSTAYTFSGLACGTGHTLAVDAYDAAGNHSTKAAVTGSTAACPDTSAPTTPGAFTVSGQTPTSVTVSWSASTDNVGVAGYTLYRDGTTVGSTQSTSYTFAGLTCGTSYTLAVEAYDAAGNHSAKSSITAAAAACSPPPPASSTVRINAGGPAYTSQNGNAFAADVYYTGGSAANGADAVSGTADPALYADERWGNFSYAIPVANGTYDIRLHFVELYFNAPCAGKRIFGVDVANTATNPDVANLDICAIVGPDTALVRTITNVNVTDGFVRLQAVFGSAEDPEIAAIEVVPAGGTGGDASPPSAPAGLSVGNQTQTGLTLSWSASTDNIGVAGYTVYRDGTGVGTTHSTNYALSGLNCGTSYTLGVDAFDAAGNHSTRSTITAKTSDCPPPQPAGPCGTTATPPVTYAHVIWIWMENKSYDQIIGSSEAPFENQLAQQCGLATNYTAATHPSLPNYIAATSGDYWGISDNNPPASHPLSVPSIYSQVRAAGKEWREYEENAPGNCPQDTVYPYAVKHDPAAYYKGIRNDCFNWNVPMGTTSGGNFLNDLSSNSLPAFAFITPDLCNDTHDCSVATGDAWLKSWISLILTSAAYKSGTTALFLTWDEDDGSSTNRVVTVVVSPSTRPGTTSSTAFTHYSLLKTTEQMLGITTYLGHAADPGTASMRSAFNS